MIGIYKIENKVNKKLYLVKTKNINLNTRQLKYKLRNSLLTSFYIQNDWHKYGENNFTFSLVEECKEEELVTKYNYYKEQYKDNLYNPANKKRHPWHREPVVLNLAPKTEMILDADGDLLPLKFCIQCELHKLEDSFIKTSFYCRDCRQLNDEIEVEIEEILSNIIM